MSSDKIIVDQIDYEKRFIALGCIAGDSLLKLNAALNNSALSWAIGNTVTPTSPPPILNYIRKEEYGKTFPLPHFIFYYAGKSERLAYVEGNEVHYSVIDLETNDEQTKFVNVNDAISIIKLWVEKYNKLKAFE